MANHTLELSTLNYEEHVKHAFLIAHKIAEKENREITAADLLRAVLIFSRDIQEKKQKPSSAFSKLIQLLPLSELPPASLDEATSPYLPTLRMSSGLAEVYSVAPKSIFTNRIWGRDYITFAVLAINDSTLQEVAHEAGTTMTRLQDTWFEYVTSDSTYTTHRPKEEWEQWWKNVGVLLPHERSIYARSSGALNDRPIGADRLNFDRYAEAFADFLINKETKTPLTIGIYGTWGMGKSFLMKKIAEKIDQRLTANRIAEIKQQRLAWSKSPLKETFNRLRGRLQSLLPERQPESVKESPEKDWHPWIRRLKKILTRPPFEEIDFHFIEFNAWVYSGSEVLWAGFVTHLYQSIEKYLGQLAASYFRLGEKFFRSLSRTVGILLLFGLLGFGFSMLLSYKEVIKHWNAVQIAFNSLFVTAISGSALVAVRALFLAIRDLSEAVVFSRAMQLKNLSTQRDFREQIGFMADIKEEVSLISRLLKRGKNGRSTRVVIFIDDLDRCPPKKAVEVLQSIMLLLADEDGAPFIIFLGLDARVIVRAIEEEYGEVLVNAGITGYEYLDKIVQIPFSVPTADQKALETYVEPFLLKSANDKHGHSPQKVESEKTGQSVTADNQNDQPTLAINESDLSANKQEHIPKNKPEISEIFSDAERQAFKDFTKDLIPNPRRIKRMINIYRYVRHLVPLFRDEQRRKLIRWIILTEQWPFRTAWILEKVDNDFQSICGFINNQEAPLKEVYESILDRIYDKDSRELLIIDGDPERFLKFIQGDPILTVSDIQALHSLTFNLNPAIRYEVSKIAVRADSNKPQKSMRISINRGFSTDSVPPLRRKH